MTDSLADALEACRRRLLLGDSVEQCCAAYPGHAEELSLLLPLIEQVQRLRQEPDATFAAAARRRFQDRVTAARSSETARRSGAASIGPMRWLRRLAIPAALTAALLGSGAGLVQASAQALPDSPLYGLQQVREHVVQQLARTPAQRAENQIHLATFRLDQLRRAEAVHKGPRVLGALSNAMVAATARAVQALGQTTGPRHEELLAQLRPVMVQEEVALQRQRLSANAALAASTVALQQQLRAVQYELNTQPATPIRRTPRRPTPHVTMAPTTLRHRENLPPNGAAPARRVQSRTAPLQRATPTPAPTAHGSAQPVHRA